MGFIFPYADDEPPDDPFKGLNGSNRDTYIQLAISAPLGLLALITFCILRPRWPSLYAARKKQKDVATILPELPSSFAGWIPVLWRITDQQILASAGLDAYVFLDFFKMAAQYLFITLFFALVVIKPVHDAFPDKGKPHTNSTKPGHRDDDPQIILLDYSIGNKTGHGGGLFEGYLETDFLWMYVIFAYVFSGLAVYLLVTHTRKVISIRQEYLGTQSTITDRTIRLSGIPNYLQDEAKIKAFVEELDIGKVETVVLCRDWNEIDSAMRERMDVLRRLELAYTIYAGQKADGPNAVAPPAREGRLIDVDDNEDDGEDSHEHDQLLGTNGQSQTRRADMVRPQVTLRSGNFSMQSRKVDAIDYYSERLRNLDEKIKDLRKSEFRPMPLAFVTMDSVAAAQMAIQAVLDPSPLELIANYSPPPSEVVWRNTYQSRRKRMVKSWVVTALIALLTIFWSLVLVPIAGLLNTEAIGKAFPGFADLLEQHRYIESLVNTQLPVLIVTLLTVGVPYLYYYLSWYQGFISASEIELSAISKNFFFTFFNFFLLFTILGTASNFYKFLERFGDALQNFRDVAKTLAQSLRLNLRFYTNFLILQSLTLHPVRLLELGTVALYPIYLMGAKTPRDYAELVQPPFFTYAYYLPTALLVFIISMAYSVLRDSWTILLAGFSYFFFGHFVYKYQLLYAMDHSPHATGRAWGMICDRVFLAMIFFQITTTGQLIFENAIPRTITMIPLIAATIWFSIVFGRTYKPLLKFIALQNIKKAQTEEYTSPDNPLPTAEETEQNVWADPDGDQWRYYRESRSTSPQRQEALRFVNPSLVQVLHGVWIADKSFADGVMNRAREPDEDAADLAQQRGQNGSAKGRGRGIVASASTRSTSRSQSTTLTTAPERTVKGLTPHATLVNAVRDDRREKFGNMVPLADHHGRRGSSITHDSQCDDDVDARDASSDGGSAQAGVKRAEVIASTWSRWDLYIAYFGLSLLAFATSLESLTTTNLQVYATSAYRAHSLISTVLVVQGVVLAVVKPPMSKIADVFGRFEAFSLSVIIYTLGYVQQAASTSVETFAAAQIFYSAGQTGLQILIQIFIADTSDLVNRALCATIPYAPYLVNSWIGAPLANLILDQLGWRWGYGMWAIVLPIAFIPLALALGLNQRNAARKGVLPCSPFEGLTWMQTASHLWYELDFFGLTLLCGAFSLILIPLSLAANTGWDNPKIITLLVLGGICLVIFPFWERSKRLAPRAFFPMHLFTKRTVLAGLGISFFYFMAYYMSVFPYFQSYLLVVQDKSVSTSGLIVQTWTFAATVTSICVSFAIKHMKRYRIFVICGSCIYLAGLFIMVLFRTENSSTLALVVTQIIVGSGGGMLNIPAQTGVQASASHQEVAAATAIFLTFLEIGGACGSAISGAIWSASVPKKLRQYLPDETKDQAAAIYGNITLASTGWPMGDPTRQAINRAYQETMTQILMVAVCIAVPVVLLSLLMKDYKLDEIDQHVKGLVIGREVDEDNLDEDDGGVDGPSSQGDSISDEEQPMLGRKGKKPVRRTGSRTKRL